MLVLILISNFKKSEDFDSLVYSNSVISFYKLCEQKVRSVYGVFVWFNYQVFYA